MTSRLADLTPEQRAKTRAYNREYASTHRQVASKAASAPSAKPSRLPDPARRLLLAAQGQYRGQHRFGLTPVGPRPANWSRDRAGDEADAAFGSRAQSLAAHTPPEDRS